MDRKARECRAVQGLRQNGSSCAVAKRLDCGVFRRFRSPHHILSQSSTSHELDRPKPREPRATLPPTWARLQLPAGNPGNAMHSTPPRSPGSRITFHVSRHCHLKIAPSLHRFCTDFRKCISLLPVPQPLTKADPKNGAIPGLSRRNPWQKRIDIPPQTPGHEQVAQLNGIGCCRYPAGQARRLLKNSGA